ncbi:MULTISPECIES: hypothetical protein [Bacillus cereus group]|uniref:hypothetical protein n=1 Tax=Bacillus cereus group TaxID=86661 RepID=UPI001F567903|nr:MULTISPECIES: hypothetical protein [Bacillus cereus group]MCR6791669.1 hypothetical protein [Bacillus paranthracis]MCR6792047.1 hypothetical protein [Bacillus paranthracis]MED1168864.1 hypothetical protein [Bacillus paranthracis]MED1169565.1 hypothetical protein [Bacillus paranthracis]
MKFVVLKSEDIDKVANKNEIAALNSLSLKINNMRFNEGRTPNPEYLVVNKDEPYAEKVLCLIMKHEGEL